MTRLYCEVTGKEERKLDFNEHNHMQEMLVCRWLTERANGKLRQLGNPNLVEAEGQGRSHVNEQLLKC